MTHPDDQLDLLERELQAMKPAPPSPALRPRIAIALTASRPSRSTWFLLMGTAAALLIVPPLVLSLAEPFLTPRLIYTSCQYPVQYRDPPPDTRPSLWAYHQAAARSSQDFENLLDTHARTLPPLGAPTPRPSSPLP
jgi:hypothetical protein